MKLTDKLGGKLMILRGEKNCLKKFCSAFAVLLALLTLALPVHTVFGADNIPAFPGAEGGLQYTMSQTLTQRAPVHSLTRFQNLAESLFLMLAEPFT